MARSARPSRPGSDRSPSPFLGLAVYAFVAPLALGLIANWDRLKLLKDAPAWLQAVGSIVAIAGAWLTVSWQARDERLREEERRRFDAKAQREALERRYRAGRGAIQNALDAARGVRRVWDEAGGDSAALQVSAPLRWSLNSLDILDYYVAREHDDPALVGALFGAKRHLPELIGSLQTYNQGGGAFWRVRAAADDAAASLESILFELDHGVG